MTLNNLCHNCGSGSAVCFLPVATSYLPGFRSHRPRAAGTPMTTSPEPSSPLARALKQLATATKAVSFYPAQHPTVVSALQKAVALLKEALSTHDTLTVGVGQASFLVDGAALEEADRGLAGFAGYLGR